MDGIPPANIKFKDFPKFTESNVVNKEINNLFTLIFNDFVASWFFMISEDKDEEFIEELSKIIDGLIKDVVIRLNKIDYVQLLLIDFPVVIKQHIKDFYDCKEKCNTFYSNGKSFEEIFHGLQPHFALNNPQKETEYFRKLMEIMIRNSLPEPEKNLEPLVLILREIMSKIVLENTIDSLAEPNFIYECIAKILEDKPEEMEETTTENIMTNEIIIKNDIDSESNKSFEKPQHPNSFKRNTLTNYNNLQAPLSFNNFNNNKGDENSYVTNTNPNETVYDDDESLSDTEYSDSIYRMIKLDKEEEANGLNKKKSTNTLSKTPGAFPLSPDLHEGEGNTEENEYLNYFDSSYQFSADNEDSLVSRKRNSNYSELISIKLKSKNSNNSIQKNKNNTKRSSYQPHSQSQENHSVFNRNNETNISKIEGVESNTLSVPEPELQSHPLMEEPTSEHEHPIQTEPPPTFYSTLTKKINFKEYREITNKSIQLVYTNIMNSLKMTYQKMNSLLDFVRKPFNLFNVSSEKYNDYQLYIPFFDVIDLIFQFSTNDTWIWNKTCNLMDFFSYFRTGKLINRSLIRGVGWILSEDKVAWYMNELSTSLWPDGHFMESSPPPTPEETEISRKIAELMMKESIPNSIKSMFGKGVIDEGFNRILEIFQNKTVNKHLLFILLDLIFLNIYPEHYNQLTNLQPKYIQKPMNITSEYEANGTPAKGMANSQLEHELLSASNEPLLIPNNLTASASEQEIALRKRKLKTRSSTSVEKLDVKRSLASSSSAPSFSTNTHSVNTSNRKKLKRVSNYIKYVLNLKPLNSP